MLGESKHPSIIIMLGCFDCTKIGRTMNKKVKGCIGLIAIIMLIIAAKVAVDRTRAAGPLRVGMTGEELDSALGQPMYKHWCDNAVGRHLGDKGEVVIYKYPPDRQGNERYARVSFNDGGLVVDWKIGLQYPDKRSFWAKIDYAIQGLSARKSPPASGPSR
jgi:hypothetical protein